MTEIDDNLNTTEAPTPSPQYQLASLTMVGANPWFSVHSTDSEGRKSSWIISATLEGEQFNAQLQVWVPEAIQALAGDAKGFVWAITVNDQLITNSPVATNDGWTSIEPHPLLQQSSQWFQRRLRFELQGQPAAELAGCLLWYNEDLLIGTFSRRLYRLEGAMAVLEDDGHQPGKLGGINDIVATDQGVFAVGYGGTVLHREQRGQWSPLQGPWPQEAAPFVNVVSAAQGLNNDLWAIVAGGSVIASEGDVLRPLASLPAEPLGITGFQGERYVSTLDGCYQVFSDGRATLVKDGLVMGRAIDAGIALVAFDAEPDELGTAAIHVWLRSRTMDRWVTQVICRS
ncbi:hypothetical protein [Pseudomonas prosekii]|uniref:hypothetical protein n=1 Tax=Pseudomonas prosekii TaxID=1148509 RepID=UPI003F75705F